MRTSKVFFMVGLVASASLLASCSDSNDTPEVVDPTVTITGLGATSDTDATELAKRVTNYKSASAVRKAAADATIFAGILDMPEEPTTVPTSAVDLKTIADLSTLSNGGTYYIKKGAVIDFSANARLKNCTIYVEKGGEMKLGASGTSGDNTIYVLTGGILTLNAGETLSESVTGMNDKVYCYGDVNVSGKYFTVNNGGSFYKKGNLTLTDKYVGVWSNSKMYVDGTVRAKALRVQTNCKANITNKALINTDVVAPYEVNVEVDNGAALHVGNTFECLEMGIYGGKIYADCGVRGVSKLNMSGEALLKTNYLRVANATQNGASKIIVGNEGVLNFDSYTTDNTAGQIELPDADGIALVKAKKFIYAGNGEVNTFSTPANNSLFLLELSNCYQNGSDAEANLLGFDDVSISASYLDYSEPGNNAKTDSIGCGYKLNVTSLAKKPKLDLISAITYPDEAGTHTDKGLSATCIQPGNGHLYMSYHTRGAGHGACVEVFKRTGEQITLEQYLKDAENDLDFNHLMVDNNRVYLAGSSNQKGAMVAYIDINADGKLNTEDKEITIDEKTGKRNAIQIVPVELQKQNGFDANCVVKYGKDIVVASTRGYETYDATNDAFTHSFASTNGAKTKHLAVSDDNIYALRFTENVGSEDTLKAVPAQLEVYSDASMTTPVAVQSVGEIAPNNGKNTIAVEKTGAGHSVYVCKSANGLASYDFAGTSSSSKWNWAVPTNEKGLVKGYCNGVAVSSAYPDYVFVACGGYGLVVLDKATGKEITHRSAATKQSANYVYVDNEGYIYVAYGKSRMQVFKLTDTVK